MNTLKTELRWKRLLWHSHCTGIMAKTINLIVRPLNKYVQKRFEYEAKTYRELLQEETK